METKSLHLQKKIKFKSNLYPLTFATECSKIINSLLTIILRLHLYGDGIAAFLNPMSDALSFRLTCTQAKNAVAVVPFQHQMHVYQNIASWRACYPRALSISLKGRKDIKDNVFRHLEGIKWIDIRDCEHLTDDAFIHVNKSISKLDISACRQITNASFVHFINLKHLTMKSCFQSQITDAGLRLLTNIKYLDISGCNQRSISDTIFVLMPKLNELRIGCCDQFTDAAFQHLSGLKLLDMGLCDQPEITGSGFKYLTNLQSLNMAHCDQITGYNLLYLTKLKELDISHCSQLEYNSLKHLFSVGNIKKLVYTWCFEGQSMPEWFQSYLFN
jgi:hypothetical protein